MSQPICRETENRMKFSELWTIKRKPTENSIIFGPCICTLYEFLKCTKHYVFEISWLCPSKLGKIDRWILHKSTLTNCKMANENHLLIKHSKSEVNIGGFPG
jgi:hypothetical protein